MFKTESTQKNQKDKIFIDNGKILITSFDGEDYLEKIKRLEKSDKIQLKVTIVLGIVMFSCLLMGISPVFFHTFNSGQIATLFTVATLCFFFLLASVNTTNKYQIVEIRKKINLAKFEHAEEILRLEKILAQHHQDLQTIEFQKNMNFMGIFKKEDGLETLA